MIDRASVDVVVVNWNSGPQLQECIASIRLHGHLHVGRVVVVDNGSVDGSTDFLAGKADVDLVLTGENLGFGRACNLGAARSDSAFVLFLNPDACLMPGSLDLPLEFFARPESEQIGIVGISLVTEDGAIQRSCARFPTPWQMLAKSAGILSLMPKFDFHMVDWDHLETRAVDHVIGAFYLIRRSLFDRLSGFDELFFVYLEDLDLSRRAELAGYGTMYLTEAQAYHKGGGVSEQVKAHRLFYSLRSRIQYAFKHFSIPAALLVATATLTVEPFSRLVFILLRGRGSDVPDLWRGYKMLWGWVFAQSLRGRFRD